MFWVNFAVISRSTGGHSDTLPRLAVVYPRNPTQICIPSETARAKTDFLLL
jgi:hypothetical protein